MALVSPLSVLLHPLIKHFSIALVALGVVSSESINKINHWLPDLKFVVHELALRATSLGAWALSIERLGLISKNKEGITSLPGEFNS